MIQNPFAEIVDIQISQQRTSRIPFVELCAYYAALRWDVGSQIIAVASGLSRGAVAHLKSAGEPRSGAIRYPKVRAEFDRLGLEAFSTTYLTPVMHQRILAATDQVRLKTVAPKPHHGVNPIARKYAGLHAIGAFQIEIAFRREPPVGWRWRNLTPAKYDQTIGHWRGDPRQKERPFAKSEDAWRLAQLRFAPTDAQLESNETDAAGDDMFFLEKIYPNLKKQSPAT